MKKAEKAAIIIVIIQGICLAAADRILERLGWSHNYYYLIIALFLLAGWSYLHYLEPKK